MKLIFVSLNKDFINEIQKLLNESQLNNIIDIEYKVCDIQEIDVIGKAFISPANSIGFMDGGIDYVLSRKMFPSVETRLKTKIENLNKVTLIGRPYLPIGSAIAIPTQYSSCIMISAPTMFLPHDVSQTRNAYHAFMASLCLLSKYRERVCKSVDTLVCTSLCCGWGKMSPSDSAKQIYNALCDFLNGKIDQEVEFQDDPYVYITTSKDNEQPNHYDNREIKNIF